jgi:hypothetical protein
MAVKATEESGGRIATAEWLPTAPRDSMAFNILALALTVL